MKRVRYDSGRNDDVIIKEALDVLRNGGLIVGPSDTVYGLYVDATNQKAVEKLISFKNRPWGKPISVFVADYPMMEKEVKIGKGQRPILDELLPGPFTVILNSRHLVSKLLESEKGTLGIRIPEYNLVRAIVSRFARPMTATSANLSGRPPHYSVDTLLKELPESKKGLIDLIIDAGKLPRNKPSTVVDLVSPQLKIVRSGDVVFKDSKTYISESPAQTKKIAQHVFKKLSALHKSKEPLIFIIQGDLGAGKTVFVKGIAENLGIEKIISPTYVIYYEYDVQNKTSPLKKLIHLDLYAIQDSEEFKHLGIQDYLKKGVLFCFEWGEKAGEIMDQLKKKGKVVFVSLKYLDESKREIKINI